jgi:hypothetical protein
MATPTHYYSAANTATNTLDEIPESLLPSATRVTKVTLVGQAVP